MGRGLSAVSGNGVVFFSRHAPELEVTTIRGGCHDSWSKFTRSNFHKVRSRNDLASIARFLLIVVVRWHGCPSTRSIRGQGRGEHAMRLLWLACRMTLRVDGCEGLALLAFRDSGAWRRPNFRRFRRVGQLRAFQRPTPRLTKVVVSSFAPPRSNGLRQQRRRGSRRSDASVKQAASSWPRPASRAGRRSPPELAAAASRWTRAKRPIRAASAGAGQPQPIRGPGRAAVVFAAPISYNSGRARRKTLCPGRVEAPFGDGLFI